MDYLITMSNGAEYHLAQNALGMQHVRRFCDGHMINGPVIGVEARQGDATRRHYLAVAHISSVSEVPAVPAPVRPD